MLSLSVKYWLRTCNLETQDLVHKSYLDSICNFKVSYSDWAGKIFNLLSLLDLSHLWEQQGSINGRTYSNMCKTSLKEIYTSF